MFAEQISCVFRRGLGDSRYGLIGMNRFFGGSSRHKVKRKQMHMSFVVFFPLASRLIFDSGLGISCGWGYSESQDVSFTQRENVL